MSFLHSVSFFVMYVDIYVPIRLFLPKPNMKAFEWEERLEPSITKSFLRG